MKFDELLRLLELYCRLFPQNVNSYKFPKPNNLIEFEKEIEIFIKWAKQSYKTQEFISNNDMKNNELSDDKISALKQYNRGITAFNDLIEKINLHFKKSKYNCDLVVFDIPETDYETNPDAFIDQFLDDYDED